jgi:hypothetical protein
MSQDSKQNDVTDGYRAAEDIAAQSKQPSQQTREAIARHAQLQISQRLQVLAAQPKQSEKSAANQPFWSVTALASVLVGVLLGALTFVYWPKNGAPIVASVPETMAKAPAAPAKPQQSESAPADQPVAAALPPAAQTKNPEKSPSQLKGDTIVGASDAIRHRRQERADPKQTVDMATQTPQLSSKDQAADPKAQVAAAAVPPQLPVIAAPAPAPALPAAPPPPATVVAQEAASAQAPRSVAADSRSSKVTESMAARLVNKNSLDEPLIAAVNAMSLSQLDQWLGSGPPAARAQQLNQILPDGQLPLTATLRKNLAVDDKLIFLKRLLDAGADPNLADRNQTPATAKELARQINDVRLNALFNLP